MNYYVYLTTNLINKKQYIGDHFVNTTSKNYIGSGILLHKALKKYGKKNFSCQILEYFETRQEAFNAQEKWIIVYNTLTPKGYNISPKGGHQAKNSVNEETKQKIKNKLKGVSRNAGENNPFFGKKLSKDHKNKIRKKLLGRVSPNKGNIASNETRKLMSKNRIGKPHPQKTIKCEYCGIETIAVNIKRYHGDKCKAKI